MPHKISQAFTKVAHKKRKNCGGALNITKQKGMILCHNEAKDEENEKAIFIQTHSAIRGEWIICRASHTRDDKGYPISIPQKCRLDTPGKLR